MSDDQDIVVRAAQLLLERRRAQASFASWCRVAGYEPARHHMLIVNALEAAARGTGPRQIMLFMPPGAAKSTYGSMLFPPWFLSQFPTKSIIAASHTMELAERWGRRCRNLIEEFPETLGIMTADDNRAAGRWQLAAKDGTPAAKMGEYLAAGVDKAIAGFRADFGLIDDPVKGKKAVESEAQREAVWEWYKFDFRTRLKPGAIQVLICTRWHEEDLAGKLLQEEGSQWHVISLPMVSEDVDDPLGRPIGERLWPEWFTEEMVAQAMSDAGLWNSLYQQRPTSEQGTYWRKEWLHEVAPSQVPTRRMLRIYGGSDYAVSADRGDYTVHAVLGLDDEDRPWLIDLWRARTSSNVWVDAWAELVKFYKPMAWGEEQGQIISGVGPFLEREAHAQKAYTERVQFVSRADKGVRAQSIRGHIAAKGLWYGSDLPHKNELVAELLAFPNGKHDDLHDALGIIGQLLDVMLKAEKPKQPKTDKASGYRTVGTKQPSGIKVL